MQFSKVSEEMYGFGLELDGGIIAFLDEAVAFGGGDHFIDLIEEGFKMREAKVFDPVLGGFPRGEDEEFVGMIASDIDLMM